MQIPPAATGIAFCIISAYLIRKRNISPFLVTLLSECHALFLVIHWKTYVSLNRSRRRSVHQLYRALKGASTWSSFRCCVRYRRSCPFRLRMPLATTGGFPTGRLCFRSWHR